MHWLAIMLISLILGGIVPTTGAETAGVRADARRARPPSRSAEVPSERLRFRASWNGVPVARAELSLDPSPGENGGSVVFEGRAETNEVLDLLWRMRDGFEATVAAKPIAPRRFVLRQHENQRRRETTVTADTARRSLVGSRRKRGRPPKVTTIPLERDVHDPASLAYLIRTRGPELRERETYRVFAGSQTYRVGVAPAGDETIMTIGRSWRARKLHLTLELPDAESAGRTQPRIQEAELWVSSGPEKLPLRLQGKTLWGWVVIELVGRGAPAQQPVGAS